MNTTDNGEWPRGLKWFWALVGGMLCVAGGVGTGVRLTPTTQAAFDFAQEWSSARNYLTGHPIYENLEQSLARHLGSHWQLGAIKVNAHPPVAVLAVLPWGLLEYRPAHLLWNLLSLSALVASVWLLIGPRGLGLSRWYWLPIGSFVLTSSALAQQVFQGQFNLILLLLITAAWIADREQRPVLSGAFVGLATALKLFPGFLLLYFVVRRRWRALGVAVLTCAALHGLAAGVLGVEACRVYFREIVPQVSRTFCDFWLNASLWGYWNRLFAAPNGHVVPWIVSPPLAKAAALVTTAVLIALSAWQCHTAGSRRERDRAFGLCVVAMILVSPIAWDHYFLLLLVPLLILWRYLPRTAWYRLTQLALILMLATLRPRWLWDWAVGGEGDLPAQVGTSAPRAVASTLQAVTVIAYQFYALLGVFLLAAFGRIRGTQCGRRGVSTGCGRAGTPDSTALRDDTPPQHVEQGWKGDQQ